VLISPALVEQLPIFTHEPDQIAILPEVPEETRRQLAVHVLPRPRRQPVRDRRNASRLDEPNHVWCDSHANLVPAAQQLAAESDARLDIATTSVACQREFH
jgi:hypothetical protein